MEKIIEQYIKLKHKHGDTIILFRSQDCYQSIDDDAEVLHKDLGTQIIKRTTDLLRMTNFPAAQLTTYLPKLVRKGHRVVIVDSLEELFEWKRNAEEEKDCG